MSERTLVLVNPSSHLAPEYMFENALRLFHPYFHKCTVRAAQNGLRVRVISVCVLSAAHA